MNNIKSLFKKLLTNLGTGVGIALGMVLTFAVVFAFQSPGGTPSTAGFQSGGSPILTKAGGTYDRETMSLQAVAEKMNNAISSTGEVKGGIYGGGYYTSGASIPNACALAVLWGKAQCGPGNIPKCETGYTKQVLGGNDGAVAGTTTYYYMCVKT